MRTVALKIKRYRQEPGECAVAAAAAAANYFNPAVDYDLARQIAKPDGSGTYTPDIAILLNRLGFQKVTIVTADLELFDQTWKKLSRGELVDRLKRIRKATTDASYRETAGQYIKWLQDDRCDNNVIIDHRFGSHIREHLTQKKPALASFNFQLFHGVSKWNDYGEDDPIKGESSEHEVVISGCDNDGVEIVDSHYECYTGKLSKFRSGRYRMDWETLHTVMGFGDLIIPDEYCRESADYELV